MTNKSIIIGQKMLVSIIMAVKNTAPFLADCLDSILVQSYTNWELVAVDDHSSDGSTEIITSYARQDQRIRYVLNSKRGLIPALQCGYAHSTGVLINRMDSDDVMSRDKLKILVDAFRKVGQGHVIAALSEPFVDHGVVGGGFRQYALWLGHVARYDRYRQDLYKECVIPSQCWMIHRVDFEEIGAFDADVYPEDYDMVFRIFRSRLVIVGVDAVVHFCRDHPRRISRTYPEYRDNRFFEIKIHNFCQLDRDVRRPLVLWGAGQNGKDVAKLLIKNNIEFRWVCDNSQKIGHCIYGVDVQSLDAIQYLQKLQIIVAVASPKAQTLIKKQLAGWDKKPMTDYWFFI